MLNAMETLILHHASVQLAALQIYSLTYITTKKGTKCAENVNKKGTQT